LRHPSLFHTIGVEVWSYTTRV